MSSSAAAPVVGLLPPSSSSSESCTAAAKLRVGILSAYDLPTREPPVAIQVSVNGAALRTGPPAQRHKDRNSFKFDSGSSSNAAADGGDSKSNNSKLTFSSPSLPDLYNATAVITVKYANSNNKNAPANGAPLTAKYPLHQLRVNETTWLILQLSSRGDVDDEGSNGAASAEDGDIDDEDDDDVPPTLRLQMTLEGPYRAEIGWAVSTLQHWFRLVDQIEGRCRRTARSVSVPSALRKLDPKYVLIPAAPLAALAVVSAPVVLGVLTIALPVALPVLVVLGLIVGGLVVAAAVVAASTEAGRAQVGHVLAPVAHTLRSTPAGQRLVYRTGPRPNPVTVARAVLPDGIWGRLVVSLAIDALGSASYLVPVAGEAVDVVWAPLQTVLIMALYDERVSSNLKYLSFVEEILPLTDIVPTATLGWLAEFAVPLVLPPSRPGGRGKQHSRAQQQNQPWLMTAAAATNQGGANGWSASSVPATPVRAN